MAERDKYALGQAEGLQRLEPGQLCFSLSAGYTKKKKKKKDLFPKMLPLLKIGETEEMALVSSNERNSKT